MTMIPDTRTTERSMILPSTGKEIKYYSMGSSVEKELGRIKNTYRDVFIKIAEEIKDDSDAKAKIAEEMKDMTRDLVMVLQPSFPELDLNTITEGDLEMIQINLKKRCVNDVLDLQMKCPECGGENRVKIDLNDIQIKETKHEEEIELEDGSILVIGHIPLLTSISKIDGETREEDMEFDQLVHSFKTLKIKVEKTYESMDLTTASYEDKVEWAFTRDNIKSEHREKIINFLENEAPSIDPITLKVKMCKHRLYNGKSITMSELNRLTEEDSKNKEEAIKAEKEDEFVSEVSKVKLCGNKYSTKIFTLTEYLNFF